MSEFEKGLLQPFRSLKTRRTCYSECCYLAIFLLTDDQWDLFKQLADHYSRETYRFEFKSMGERSQALKLLERNGFDTYPIEDLKGYVVKLDRFGKYAPVLKNSVAFAETPKERIFLMKDLAAVEEALKLGAEVYEGDLTFP